LNNKISVHNHHQQGESNITHKKHSIIDYTHPSMMDQNENGYKEFQEVFNNKIYQKTKQLQN